MVVQQQRPSLPALVSVAKDVDIILRSSKTVKDALAAPTIAHAVLGGMSEDELLVKISALIAECMADYFDEDIALRPHLIPVFAEFILDDFKHESLGDIKVFLKGLAMGKYGEGKTYGRLTPGKIMPMWKEYLEEKAVEREKQMASEKKTGSIELAPSVMGAIKQIGGRSTEQWLMTTALERRLKHMNNDSLRKQWKKARRDGNEWAMNLIMDEARKRGLVKPEQPKQGEKP